MQIETFLNSRRDFLKAAFWTLVTSVFSLLSGIGLAALMSPVFRKKARSGQTHEIGLLDEMPANIPQARRVEISRQDGWSRQSEQRRIYVLKTGDGCIAFSPVCTHLGCQVEWESADQRFHCPCHGGRFDRNGQAAGGPPVLPLLRLPVAIEGRRIFVTLGEE